MTEQERHADECAAIIARLMVLKASYEAARHTNHSNFADMFVRGLRAGLQVAIDGIDREINMLSVRMQPVVRLEDRKDVSITRMGMEAASSFDEGHKKVD